MITTENQNLNLSLPVDPLAVCRWLSQLPSPLPHTYHVEDSVLSVAAWQANFHSHGSHLRSCHTF